MKLNTDTIRTAECNPYTVSLVRHLSVGLLNVIPTQCHLSHLSDNRHQETSQNKHVHDFKA